MSIAVNVILSRDRMPSPDVWASAIAEAGFDVNLDREFDPFAFAGFLPCPVADRKAGFEYYFEPASSETLAQIGVSPNSVGERDSIVSFVWGSREDDSISAVVAAGVLASLSNGILVDTPGNLVAPDQSISWVRSEISAPPAEPARSSFRSKIRFISPITYIAFGAVLLYWAYLALR